MQGNASRQRIAVRYSIGMLLLLMACVAGYFSGYRAGYRAGDNTWRYNQTVVKAYNVADLVTPKPNLVAADGSATTGDVDFEPLLSLAKQALNGEPADENQINVFPSNLSLVVSANGKVHRRIRAILDELRKNAPPPASSASQKVRPVSSTREAKAYAANN